MERCLLDLQGEKRDGMQKEDWAPLLFWRTYGWEKRLVVIRMGREWCEEEFYFLEELVTIVVNTPG